MKVLLTGGCGFVGINIARRLLEGGHQVVVFDSRPMLESAGAYLREAGYIWFVRGDVLQPRQLTDALLEYGIDTVVHGAAITPDTAREKNSFAQVMEVNLRGTLNILDAARKHGIGRFVYLSSVAVYGDASQMFDTMKEDTQCNPCNVYELSKYTSERAVMRYRELFGLNAYALRLADVFGVWETNTGVRDTLSAPCLALRAAMRGEEVRLSREGYCGWVYVRDIASSVEALLATRSLNHTIYHSGAVWRWSIARWCEKLADRYPGFRWRIVRPGEESIRYHANRDNGMFEITRLTEDTGYKPQYDLPRAFDDYLAWAEQHRELVMGKE